MALRVPPPLKATFTIQILLLIMCRLLLIVLIDCPDTGFDR